MGGYIAEYKTRREEAAVPPTYGRVYRKSGRDLVEYQGSAHLWAGISYAGQFYIRPSLFRPLMGGYIMALHTGNTPRVVPPTYGRVYRRSAEVADCSAGSALTRAGIKFSILVFLLHTRVYQTNTSIVLLLKNKKIAKNNIFQYF